MKEMHHALAEDIWKQVHDLVDELTKNLIPDDDTAVREHLTETFRFWRR